MYYHQWHIKAKAGYTCVCMRERGGRERDAEHIVKSTGQHSSLIQTAWPNKLNTIEIENRN